MSRKQTRQELEGKYQKTDPWGYQVNEWDRRRKAKLLETIIEVMPGASRVVDFGCGEGWITADLPGEVVVGVDISLNALLRCPTRVRTFRMDMYEDDLAPVRALGPYDLVLVTGALYGATPDDVDRLLDLVVSGGVFVVCHIQGRPWGRECLKEPPAGWMVERHELFPYRGFEEELMVLRRHDLPAA